MRQLRGRVDGDAGTGGASATGGSGTGGQTATGGTTGTGGLTGAGGVHSHRRHPWERRAGDGRIRWEPAAVGTGGSGTGGAGTGGSGTGANGRRQGHGRQRHRWQWHGRCGRRQGAGAGGSAGGSSGSYDPCPTNGDPCKVLPLGDSITYGLITVAADKASSDPSVNGKDSHGGYRVKLFSDAVGASHKMTFVGSQMNGPTTVANMPFPDESRGLERLRDRQIQGKAANDLTSGVHIILVHAGTNDTYGSHPSGTPARLSTLVDYLTTNVPERADRRGEDHSLSLADDQHEPDQQQHPGHGCGRRSPPASTSSSAT